MDYLIEENIFNYQGLYNFKDSMKTFPLGTGIEASLNTIASFPWHKKLFKIEMEGQLLAYFSNVNPKGVKYDIWGDWYNRVALFVDDLQELHENKYITGVRMITQYEQDLIKYNDLLKKGFSANEKDMIEYAFIIRDGNKETLTKEKPILDNYLRAEYGDFLPEERDEVKEEYFEELSKLVYIEKYIQLTPLGQQKYREYIAYNEFPERLKPIVLDLLSIGRYETAVRDVAVEIEDMIKKTHKTDLFGLNLIDFHINECIKANDGNFNAGIKVYKSELIINNKYIRNKYTHQRVKASQETHKAILYRQAYLFSLIDMALKKILLN